MREPAQSSSQSILSNVNRRGVDVLHQLFDRGFTWIVASEAVVDIGVLARVAAQSWVAYDLTGSSLWVGAVAAFRAIPSFLSSAVAAYIGNHVNHRILVASMRACIGILAIIQAILIGTGAMRPWHQAVLTLFTGLAIAFAWPSFVTFLNDIVQPRMATRANAVLSYSHNLGELIGPIAVGIIIALVGADWSFVFIAILYLGGAVLILNVPMPDHDSRLGNYHHPYIWTLRIGLHNIGRAQPLPWLIAMLLTTNLFGLAVFPLIPEYAIKVFDSGGLGFGLMTGALGGGLALGSAVVALVRLRRRASRAAVLTSLAWAAGTIAFAYSPNLPTTLLILSLMGFASMIWGNAIHAMIRTNPFTIHHPNIMNLYTIVMGTIPIGWTIGGAIAHFTTNETALFTSAIASITIISVSEGVEKPAISAKVGICERRVLKFVDSHGETGFIWAPIQYRFRSRPITRYVDRESGRWFLESKIS